MTWAAMALAAAGCFAIKLAGLSLPPRALVDRRVQQAGALLPAVLLCALAATQTLTDGRAIVLDARAPALLVAGIAVVARAPFLVVVGAAVLTAAAWRAVA